MDISSFQLFSSLRYDPLLLQNEDNTMLSNQRGNPSPFYMLRYHRDRLLKAARYFQWKEISSRLEGEDGLKRFEQDLMDKVNEIHAEGTGQGGPLKIRASYAVTGDLEVDISPAQPVSMERLFPPILTCEVKPVDESLSQGQGARLNHDDTVTSFPGNTTTTKLWCVLLDAQSTSPSPFTTFKTTYRDVYNEARSRVGIKSFQEPSEVILVNPRGEIMEGSLTTVYFFRGGRWVTPPLASGGQAGTTRRWLLEQRMCQEEVIRADSVMDGEYCYLSNGVRGLISGKIKLQLP